MKAKLDGTAREYLVFMRHRGGACTIGVQRLGADPRAQVAHAHAERAITVIAASPGQARAFARTRGLRCR